MAIESVDVRLKKWGRFHRDTGSGLGFPSQSPESRMNEGGCSGGQCDDGYVPDDVQATEQAVLAMSKQFPELGAVVKEFYMTSHRSDVMAERLSRDLPFKVSRTKLFELVDRAHHCIAMHVGEN